MPLGDSRAEKSLSRLWARQLRRQVALTAPLELAFLDRMAPWRRASRIIDLGCGPGYFLERLVARFAQKHFFAVDVNREHLGRARRIGGGRVRISHLDVLAPLPCDYPRFELGLARLLVQHLSSLDHFFGNAARLIEPGGHLLILDADDDLIGWTPEVPTVTTALDRLSARSQAMGAGRNDWARVQRAARGHGFEIREVARLLHSSRTNKRAFHDVFLGLGELMPRAFGLALDERRYSRELRHWLHHPDSQAQFGMKALLLRRRDRRGEAHLPGSRK